MAVLRPRMSASILGWLGDRCRTKTKAMPVSVGRAWSRVRNASSPPADPPTPTIGKAGDLPAGREAEAGQVRIVVAPAVAVAPRRPAHLARDDEQDLVAEAALVDVLDEGGHRVIDLAGHRRQVGHVLGAVVVGVHVPAAVGD